MGQLATTTNPRRLAMMSPEWQAQVKRAREVKLRLANAPKRFKEPETSVTIRKVTPEPIVPSFAIRRLSQRRYNALVRQLKSYADVSGYKEIFQKNIFGSSVMDIITKVAEKYKVKPEDIKGPRRFKDLVLARQEVYFYAATNTNLSMSSIGRIIGDRDHSTVISGIVAHCKRNGLTDPRTGKDYGVGA